jgi:hypothetical protein
MLTKVDILYIKSASCLMDALLVLGELEELNLKYIFVLEKALKLERAYKEESSGSICPLMY